MDYVSVFTILTFPECANKSCVNIIILDDMTVEKNENERFSISLDSTDGSVMLDPDLVDGEVVIREDNDCEYYNMDCLFLQHVLFFLLLQLLE